MNSKKTPLGFIGLGLMGKPMAARLVDAGYRVTVFNRSVGPMRELEKRGAELGDSPRGVAQVSDVVITMLPNSPDVEQVCLGEDGIREGCRPGKVVIDMSTISPRISQKISEMLARDGVHMLEAPVSGGDVGAREGTLSIMVGGEKETLDRCRAIFNVLGKKVTYCGGPGKGQTTKLVNNAIAAVTIEAIAEGFLMGVKAGVDPEAMFEAIRGGAAACWSLDHKIPMILERNFKPGFMSKLHLKDLNLALDAASDVGTPMPVTALVKELYAALVFDGKGDEDNCAVVKVLEKLAGVELTGAKGDGGETA